MRKIYVDHLSFNFEIFFFWEGVGGCFDILA